MLEIVAIRHSTALRPILGDDMRRHRSGVIHSLAPSRSKRMVRCSSRTLVLIVGIFCLTPSVWPATSVPSTPSPPYNSWSTLVNVIFGSIASMAFFQFHQTLITENGASRPYLILRAGLFTSCFTFFVYDWAVLSSLMHSYPYQNSISSALRFGNDIIMSFMLFGVTWYAARPEVIDRPLPLIAFLSTWHVLAGVWHLLAGIQYGLTRETYSVLLWHWGIVQCCYWGAYALVQRHTAESARQIRLLAVEAVVIFGVSIARLFIFFGSV